jgi:hypothetical protein
VPTGGEPGKLAISDNGQTLYFSTNSGTQVGKMDLTSQTLGAQFTLGGNGTYTVSDLAVLPGSPSSVAVARSPDAGVAIYDNGIQRPVVTNQATINAIAFANSATSLYGADSEDSGFEFTAMSVNSSGVTITAAVDGIPMGRPLVFDNGVLYGGLGRAVDPATQNVVGSFPLIGGGYVVSDSAMNRVFFLTWNGGNQTTIQAFDRTNFTLVGSLAMTLTDSPFTVGSLVRWGSDGLAFRTSSQIIFARIPALWIERVGVKRRSQTTSQ